MVNKFQQAYIYLEMSCSLSFDFTRKNHDGTEAPSDKVTV